MKRIFSFLLVISFVLLSFSGCNDSLAKYKNLPDEYVAETDVSPGFFYKYPNYQPIAPSGDGYYFSSSRFLYYADKEDMNPVPLCSSPECNHEAEQSDRDIWKCNAYVSNVQFIQFYEGSLYYNTSFFANDGKIYAHMQQNILVKSSPDGSKRVPLCEVDNDPNTWFAIHRGYFYTCAYFNKSRATGCKITRVPLSNPLNEAEVIFESEDAGSFTPMFYGGYLYVEIVTESQNLLYECALSTGESRVLIDFSDMDYGVSFEGVDKDHLYFSMFSFIIQGDSIHFLSAKSESLNRKSGEFVQYVSLDNQVSDSNVPEVRSDGESLFIFSREDNKLEIQALDSDFSKTGNALFIDDLTFPLYFAGDSRYIIITDLLNPKLILADKDNGLASRVFFIEPETINGGSWTSEEDLSPITFK